MSYATERAFADATGTSGNRLHILQHSLGVDQYGRGEQYRNHFVTGPGSVDHADCMALVAAGLMTRRDSSPLTGGDDLFQVTQAGREYVAEHSPAPPKLTRAQQRYRDFMASETGETFGEWLKRTSSTYRPLKWWEDSSGRSDAI